VLSEKIEKLRHTRRVYCLCDWRESRFDGYCWALIGAFLLFVVCIYF
jgi:hypothetical protein